MKFRIFVEFHHLFLKSDSMRLRNYAFRCLAFLSFSAFLFSGCSTELDPNDDYQETMIIYSILNPNENVHYARVSKAFQNTNSNALIIAETIPDSTTYRDILNVRLQKLGTDSAVVAEYPMVRIDTVGKESGTFFSGSQVLYRTNPGQPGKLDEKAVYRIVATNTESGLTASGATALVQENASTTRNFCIFQVSIQGGNTCLDTTLANDYDPHMQNAIIFRPPGNAFIYNIKLTFNYTETINGNTENKQLSYYVRNNYLKDVSPTSLNPTIQELVDENVFYRNLLNLIPATNQDPNTVRRAGDIYMTITAGSKSLATNFLVNNSFSVFSQTRPEFDNIANGTGLVGARLQKSVKMRLSIKALEVLRNDPQYSRLNFQ
ncbi:MAG TPA: hypothetical protein VK927_05505 [Adhaeribacter sp.]|nr:hypothetical protein [Adhaeribacter sp.]